MILISLVIFSSCICNLSCFAIFLHFLLLLEQVVKLQTNHVVLWHGATRPQGNSLSIPLCFSPSVLPSSLCLSASPLLCPFHLLPPSSPFLLLCHSLSLPLCFSPSVLSSLWVLLPSPPFHLLSHFSLSLSDISSLSLTSPPPISLSLTPPTLISLHLSPSHSPSAYLLSLSLRLSPSPFFLISFLWVPNCNLIHFLSTLHNNRGCFKFRVKMMITESSPVRSLWLLRLVARSASATPKA